MLKPRTVLRLLSFLYEVHLILSLRHFSRMFACIDWRQHVTHSSRLSEPLLPVSYSFDRIGCSAHTIVDPPNVGLHVSLAEVRQVTVSTLVWVLLQLIQAMSTIFMLDHIALAEEGRATNVTLMVPTSLVHELDVSTDTLLTDVQALAHWTLIPDAIRLADSTDANMVPQRLRHQQLVAFGTRHFFTMARHVSLDRVVQHSYVPTSVNRARHMLHKIGYRDAVLTDPVLKNLRHFARYGSFAVPGRTLAYELLCTVWTLETTSTLV